MALALGLILGDALAFYVAWAIVRMAEDGDDEPPALVMIPQLDWVEAQQGTIS